VTLDLENIKLGQTPSKIVVQTSSEVGFLGTLTRGVLHSEPRPELS